jgi:hypothetical protein
MKQKMLVLSASRYDFEDSATHRQVKGCSVVTASVNASSTSTDLVGSKPAKNTLPIERFHEFEGVSLPAISDVDYDIDLATMKAVPISFDNFVSLSGLV